MKGADIRAEPQLITADVRLITPVPARRWCLAGVRIAGGAGIERWRRRMKRRILGGTGLSVSEFALGTMMFGAYGNRDHDESIRIIHTALDAGINFVDSADVYSAGESEEIVGKALAGRRDDVVLATKFSLPTGPDANERGGSRRGAGTTDSVRSSRLIRSSPGVSRPRPCRPRSAMAWACSRSDR
jgi:Aldo/keto reductase family